MHYNKIHLCAKIYLSFQDDLNTIIMAFVITLG